MGAPHVAQRAATAERRGKAVKMRLAGYSWQDISDALDYKGKGNAYNDVRRALEKAVTELAIPVEALREIELQRLDAELERLNALYARLEKLLDKQHVAISNGRVVTLHDEPIEDDGPILHVVDRLLRIDESRRRVGERRAKLLGLDAPQRMEVLTIDDIDAQIRELNRQLGAADSEVAATAGTETADD